MRRDLTTGEFAVLLAMATVAAFVVGYLAARAVVG